MRHAELSAQYDRQERWRHWDEALACVPLKAGQRVLDLGCGVGPIAARLQRLGAQVIGVDADPALLDVARTLHPSIRFEQLDLNTLTPASFGKVDGIWASFVGAYLSKLEATLARLSDCLVEGGWIALVEMNDLFGHEPLPSSFRDALQEFYASARAAGRYDFECGHRLADAVERAGLSLFYEGTLPDEELTFQGPAPNDVLEAWRLRLQRMGGLQNFFGTRFPEFENTFLNTLASPDHRSQTQVFIVVARRHPASGETPPLEAG